MSKLGREGERQGELGVLDIAEPLGSAHSVALVEVEATEYMAGFGSIGVAQTHCGIEAGLVVGSSWSDMVACMDYTSAAEDSADVDAGVGVGCTVFSSLHLAAFVLPADDGFHSSCRLGSFLSPERPRSGRNRCALQFE